MLENSGAGLPRPPGSGVPSIDPSAKEQAISPETPRVRFLFDYISSNAYLAWLELRKLTAKYGVDLEPVPVLFAGLLEAYGQLGPAEIRPKARWMWKNNLRKAALLGVPLNPPAYHPFNPLLALRASSLPMAESARMALIDGLFEAVWVRRLHVSDASVVERIGDEAGLDGSRLVAKAKTPARKARLRAQTDEAISMGVFGVPSMVVGAEVFWGYDDLPYLELLLAGKDPIDPEEERRWRGPVRASAVRRQFRSRGEDA
ncbi:MAG: 2-hydroxychromene-2-carboxylate isomerase [Myxococcota bacterium]